MHKKTFSWSKYQKSFVCLRKMCLMVWKRTFYGNVDLSTTCQCRQFRLNPLSTQINIYCLMTNQKPALLVQRAPWTRAAMMLLQSLYFSRFLPNRPRPLSSFDTHARWQPVTQSARSRRSDGKIEDCEQCIGNSSWVIFNTTDLNWGIRQQPIT